MKSLWASLVLALRSVARSGLRSLLTSLGILIGIAAVVTVVALGESARSQVDAQIQSLGANLIYVENARGEARSQKAERRGYRLSVSDAEALRRQIPELRGVSAVSSIKAEVQSPFDRALLEVLGADPDYAQMRGYEIVSGRDLTPLDAQTKAKVCLIGHTAAIRLFGAQDPVGQMFRIGRHRFEVVGQLGAKGQSPFGDDQDDVVILPIRSFLSRLAPGHRDRTDLILASAPSHESTESFQNQIDQVMLEQHHIPVDGKRDFRLSSDDGFRQSQEEIFAMLSLVLASIAAISLFVGGVGVMNIMLVSVNERKREIGTRLAIGARPRDIRWQFLAEAMALTLLGGGLGLALARGGMSLLEAELGWAVRLNLAAVAAALAVSVALGLIFGFFPAQRAARLDPIEALRQ